MNNDESWIEPTVRKHSLDSLMIMAALLKAGLAKGECSANDIPEGVAPGSNARGAVFKLLRKAGFIKTGEIAKSEGRRRHSGLILLWKCENRYLAELAEQRISAALLSRKHEGPTVQGSLPM